MSSSLYIFIDESGNFDFSPSGTKHFVLTAITVPDPLATSQSLQALKYQLLAEGADVEGFHAAPDKQSVRNTVLETLAGLPDIHVNYLYADKRKAHPKYHSPEAIYSLFAKTLLKYIFQGRLAASYTQLIVIVDKALTKNQQKAFSRVVKPHLKETGKQYKIYFHRSVADFNGQIADYFCWAKYVSLSRGELRPLNQLSGIEQTDFNIFRRGRINYY